MEIINSMVLDIGKIILMVTATGNMEKQNDIQKEWLFYEGCKEGKKVLHTSRITDMGNILKLPKWYAKGIKCYLRLDIIRSNEMS